MGGYRLARTFFFVVVFKCYTTLYDFWNISFYGHVTIKQQQLRTPSPNPKKKKKIKNKNKNPKWGHNGARGTNYAPRAPPLPPITSKKRIKKSMRKMFFF